MNRQRKWKKVLAGVSVFALTAAMVPSGMMTVSAAEMQETGGTNMWLGILLVCFILPAVLTPIFGAACRKAGWIKEGDLKLDL